MQSLFFALSQLNFMPPNKHKNNMDKLTVVELRKLAKSRNIKGMSAMNKAQLIAALSPPETVIPSSKTVAMKAALEQVPYTPSAFNLIAINDGKYDCIVHFADIHLPLENKMAIYNDIIGPPLRETMAMSLKGRHPLIVIAGDIFDHRNRLNPCTVELFQGLMAILESFGPVAIIAGNHDVTESNPFVWSDVLSVLIKGVSHLKVHYLKESGHYRFGNIVLGVNSLLTISQVWLASKKADWHTLPKDKIESGTFYAALWHGSILGTASCVASEEDKSKAPPPSAGVFTNYQAVLLGDIHKRQIFAVNNSETYAAYPGSLVQQNQGETVQGHGFLIWPVTSGPVPARDIIAVDVPNVYAYVTHKISANQDDQMQLLPQYVTSIYLRLIGKATDIIQQQSAIVKQYEAKYKVLSTNTINILTKEGQVDGSADIALAAAKEDPIEYGLSLLAPTSYSNTWLAVKALLMTVPAKDNTTEPMDISPPHIASFSISNILFNNIYGFMREDGPFAIIFSKDNILSARTITSNAKVLDVSNSRVIGLQGPNASGKSSIIYMIFKSLFENDGRGRIPNKYVINAIAEEKKKNLVCSATIIANNKAYYIERTTKHNGRAGAAGETKLYEVLQTQLQILNAGTKPETDKKIVDLIGSSEIFLLLSAHGSSFGPHATVFGLSEAAFSETISQLFQVSYIKDRIAKRINIYSKKQEADTSAHELSQVTLKALLHKSEEQLNNCLGLQEQEDIIQEQQELEATIADIRAECTLQANIVEEYVAKEATFGEKIAAMAIDDKLASSFVDDGPALALEINATNDRLKALVAGTPSLPTIDMSEIQTAISNIAAEITTNFVAAKITATPIGDYRAALADLRRQRAALILEQRALAAQQDTNNINKQLYIKKYGPLSDITETIADEAIHCDLLSADEVSDAKSRLHFLNNAISGAMTSLKNTKQEDYITSPASCLQDKITDKKQVDDKLSTLRPLDVYSSAQACDLLAQELDAALKAESIALGPLTDELSQSPDYDDGRKLVFKSLISRITKAAKAFTDNKSTNFKTHRPIISIQADISAAAANLDNAKSYSSLVVHSRQLECAILYLTAQKYQEEADAINSKLKSNSAVLAAKLEAEAKATAAKLKAEARNTLLLGQQAATEGQIRARVTSDSIEALSDGLRGTYAAYLALADQHRLYNKHAATIDDCRAKFAALSTIKQHLANITAHRSIIRDLSAARALSSSQNARLSALVADLTTIQGKISTARQCQKAIDDISAKIDESSALAATSRALAAELRRVAALLASLPAVLLNAKVNQLNACSNEFLTSISSEFPLEINWSVPDSAEGHAISFEILRITNNVKRPILFTNCSGFERTVLSLAGKYALNIATNNILKNNIYIDESFDASDEIRAQIIPSIIDKLLVVYRQVFIVSHRADVKAMYDRSIMLTNDDRRIYTI
jgi:Calcineurin-like phosphoesterase